MLLLLAAATYALTGCMITDYPCIHDTQDYPGCQNDPTCPIALEDTQGWAHIIETSMTATDNDGDGDYSQFMTFVSQDSAGNQMIAINCQNGILPWCWHSDRYGQGAGDIDPYAYGIYTNSSYTVAWVGRPGHTGDITGSCLLGPVFDEHAFDYQFTTACMECDNDISVLVSYFTRTWEAGRREGRASLPLETKLAWMSEGVAVEGGIMFTFYDSEWTISVTQDGIVKNLDLTPFNGRTVTIDPGQKGYTFPDGFISDFGQSAEEYMYVANQLMDLRRNEKVTLTVEHNGHEWSMPFALAASWDPELYASSFDEGSFGIGQRRR
jgi:hypothetical protein